MNNYLALIIGIICAGIGGELFVRGALGLAHRVRISAGIIGATVAAFATSSPELSVALSAALAGTPQIALGDSLGSNVVNVALILGLALVISGIHTPRDSIRRDFPVALLIPLLTGALFLDGELSRVDGLLLFVAFSAWLVSAVIEARRQRSAAEQILATHSWPRVVIYCLVGLVALFAAGRLIVYGARGIALAFGIDEFIIGATIIAVGTSVPELATAIIAKLRGHDEIGLGTIIGSNIFNGGFIVAVAATIHPIVVPWREVAIALIFGILALAFTFPARSGLIERWRGVLLLVLYLVYLGAVLQP